MDTEMTAPTAAAATATVIIEPEKRSSMIGLLLAGSGSLQRILFNADKIRGVVFFAGLGPRPWEKARSSASAARSAVPTAIAPPIAAMKSGRRI